MAAEIDPVILDIRAEMGRYKAELRNSTALAQTSFARQEQSIKNLERQIRASSANIGSTLKGLAGTFGAALSVQQVQQAIDSYTRFTNQLRVAGLEGQNLTRTQQQLFETAQRYGVELEVLGKLYGGAAQAGRDLGASQGQILQLTEATSQALKITGVSAAQAGGAILGLTQALASGIVRAEEFNQINEGGLRPLLSVVAANEKFGGSVAKLRIAVADGKVTSQEFFQAILKGAASLDGQVSKAALTLSGALTQLSNAFSVYISQAADSNGVTSAVAGALELLANNLDTVAEALAVLAAILLGRYVAGAVAAAASTGVVSTAIFALQARAVGAATTMEALALASATAGRAMLAAFGGPVGVAVTALAIGIAYLATKNDEAAQAARANEQAQAILEDTSKKAADAVERLASAHGKARQEALKAAKAEYELVKQKLASAQASLLLATAEYSRVRAKVAAENAEDAGRSDSRSANFGIGANGRSAGANATQRNAELDAALTNVLAGEKVAVSLMGDLERLRKAIEAPDSSPAAIDQKSNNKKNKGEKKGPKGRDPADIEREVADKMRTLAEEELRARLDVTIGAEKRAEIQGELLELEYKNRIAEINASKDYSDAQKARLRAATNRVFGRDVNGQLPSDSPQGIALNRELERARRELEERDLSMRRDALEAESDLVEGRMARLDIERRILDITQEEERSRLEAAIAAGEIADAVQARALLERKQAADRTRLGQQFESPFEAYSRKLRNTGDNLNDEVESLIVERLDQVDDAIADAISSKIGVKDPLIKQLLALFIQQNLLRPIADALSGSRGGSGGVAGIFSSIIGSVFGRASGGYAAPNSTVRVNENRGSGVELLRMGSRGGTVIPLGQARAAQGGTVKVYNINVSADNSVTPAGFARGLAQNILAEAKRMDAQMAGATLQSVPGYLATKDRYG